MNNEPIAWMDKDSNCYSSKHLKNSHNIKQFFYIPLYTAEQLHPAKTLTDEEIINIIERLIAKWTDEFKNYENDSDEPEENKLRDDVFAILRKAQDK